MLPVVLEELIKSFLQTCRVCYTTYIDNMFSCEEEDDSECGFYKTCDACREVYMTHEGPMCLMHGEHEQWSEAEQWYEAEFH